MCRVHVFQVRACSAVEPAAQGYARRDGREVGSHFRGPLREHYQPNASDKRIASG